MAALRKWQLLALLLCLLVVVLATLLFITRQRYYQAALRPAAVVEGQVIPIGQLHSRLVARYGRDELAKMVNEVYLPRAAAKAGLRVSQQEVEEKIARLKARCGTEEEFAQFVRMRLHLEPRELERQVRLLALGEKYMLSQVELSEQEVRAYWAQNRDQFRRPERFEVLKMTLPAEREARQMLEQLRSGRDFGELARRYSIDPYTRATGGRMPAPLPLLEFSTDRRYRQVFAKLKPGDITPPLQANEGFMLIKLIRRVPAQEPDYQRDRAEARELAARAKIGDPNAWMARKLAEADIQCPLFGEDWLDMPSPAAAPPAGGL